MHISDVDETKRSFTAPKQQQQTNLQIKQANNTHIKNKINNNNNRNYTELGKIPEKPEGPKPRLCALVETHVCRCKYGRQFCRYKGGCFHVKTASITFTQLAAKSKVAAVDKMRLHTPGHVCL